MLADARVKLRARVMYKEYGSIVTDENMVANTTGNLDRVDTI